MLPALVVSTLLSQVAWTYSNIIDYEVEVETKAQDTISYERATKRRLILAASKPARWYVQVRRLAPGRDEAELGFDGATAWAFSPSSKKYAIHSRWFEQADEWKAGREFHHRYFRSFERIDRMPGKNEFLGYKKRSGVKCAVVRLSPDNEDWTEDLWIDLERHVVLRSVVRKKTVFARIVSETNWRYLRLKGPIEESRFSFTAPPGATRTNALIIP